MPRQPVLKPIEAIKALQKAGFIFIRQRGSHKIFVKGECGVVVPCHNKDLKPKTLRHIIKQLGLEPDEFLKFL